MREVGLEDLRTFLNQMPLMVEMRHPLSLVFLDEEVKVYADAWEMRADLDSPELQEPLPMLALRVEPALRYRFPSFRCQHDPLTSELNHVLLPRYDFIKKYLLCQSQIATEILSRADAEAILLILVDGLSYEDIKQYASSWLSYTTPVLVDGVSITTQGMRRIVGELPLARRLFEKGAYRPIGFTYWERSQEPLTNQIFTGFGDKTYKVRAFEEILDMLKNQDLRGTYIQIVRMGLDGASHRHWDKPQIPAAVSAILADFERMIDLYKAKGLYAHLYLTSDHGILWASEHELQVFEENPSAESPRYYEYPKQTPFTLNVQFDGESFAVLVYPYLRRRLRANEWGVHGGLSFQESIIPLIKITT